jgi:hypothetical protein
VTCTGQRSKCSTTPRKGISVSSKGDDQLKAAKSSSEALSLLYAWLTRKRPMVRICSGLPLITDPIQSPLHFLPGFPTGVAAFH